MNKKIIIIMLSAIFLTVTFSPISLVAETSLEDQQSFRVIWADSNISIDVSSQLDEPVSIPETKEIDVTVKYKLDLGEFFAKLRFDGLISRLILFRSISKDIPSAEINLSVECPKWCTATLEPSNVSIKISDEFKEAKAKVTFSINKTAPAFESSDITIKAEYKNKNNWGIRDSNNKTTVSFMPAYVSGLDYELKAEQNISPVNKTTIPINITNTGNGETIVSIKIENPPKNWNMSVDSEITISVGVTKQIYLIVTPVKTFKNETIQITLTPNSTCPDTSIGAEYLDGKSVSLSVILSNDGSFKEEDTPGFEMLILISIVVIVAVVILIVLLKRKKQ